MNDPTETIDHRVLLGSDQAEIRRQFALARVEGMTDPVVVVFDLRDPVARQLAGTSDQDNEFAVQLAMAARLGGVPFATVLSSRTEARNRIATVSPEMAASVAVADRDGNGLAVIVADGAMTLHSITRV